MTQPPLQMPAATAERSSPIQSDYPRTSNLYTQAAKRLVISATPRSLPKIYHYTWKKSITKKWQVGNEVRRRSCCKQFSCISNIVAHRKSHKNTCADSQIQKVSEAENSVKIYKVENLLVSKFA